MIYVTMKYVLFIWYVLICFYLLLNVSSSFWLTKQVMSYGTSVYSLKNNELSSIKALNCLKDACRNSPTCSIQSEELTIWFSSSEFAKVDQKFWNFMSQAIFSLFFYHAYKSWDCLNRMSMLSLSFFRCSSFSSS